MIVLSQKDKDFLMDFLELYREEMLSQGLIIEPIEFKNGWMLPESVLNDSRCEKAKEDLLLGGYFENMIIREVGKDELIINDKI